MNMPRQIGIAVLMLAAPASAQWWPHVSPKLTANHRIIRKAVVMPAQVNFQKVGVKGSEGGIPDAELIARSFRSAVVNELALRGVTVLPNPLDEAKDDTAKFAVSDLQAKYSNVEVQIHKKRNQVEKGRYTLGDSVAKFEPAREADVLVFLHGSGFALTRKRAVLGFAMAGVWGAMPGFGAEIAMVDAKTGEVLVYIRFSRVRDMRKSTEERFTDTVRFFLHDLPFPTPPPK